MTAFPQDDGSEMPLVDFKDSSHRSGVKKADTQNFSSRGVGGLPPVEGKTGGVGGGRVGGGLI